VKIMTVIPGSRHPLTRSLEGPATRAELATLDENIVRHELSELERAEMESRRREIYEMLYPLTKRGVLSNVRRGAQSKLSEVESDNVDHTETVSVWYESNRLNGDEDAEGGVGVEVPPHYTRYAAEREGVTDRTVRNRLRIAERLHPEVRDYIRGTPLADDQRGLLRLTRLGGPKLQLAAAQLIVEHGVPPRLAVERAQRVAVQVDTLTLEGQDPLLPPEIVYVRVEPVAGAVEGAVGDSEIPLQDGGGR
jgi:hypothetical protein